MELQYFFLFFIGMLRFVARYIFRHEDNLFRRPRSAFPFLGASNVINQTESWEDIEGKCGNRNINESGRAL